MTLPCRPCALATNRRISPSSSLTVMWAGSTAGEIKPSSGALLRNCSKPTLEKRNDKGKKCVINAHKNDYILSFVKNIFFKKLGVLGDRRINTIGVVTSCDSDWVNRVIWVNACTAGGGRAWLSVTRLCWNQCDLEGFCQLWEVVIQDQQVQYLTGKKVNSQDAMTIIALALKANCIFKWHAVTGSEQSA